MTSPYEKATIGSKSNIVLLFLLLWTKNNSDLWNFNWYSQEKDLKKCIFCSFNHFSSHKQYHNLECTNASERHGWQLDTSLPALFATLIATRECSFTKARLAGNNTPTRLSLIYIQYVLVTQTSDDVTHRRPALWRCSREARHHRT